MFLHTLILVPLHVHTSCRYLTCLLYRPYRLTVDLRVPSTPQGTLNVDGINVWVGQRAAPTAIAVCTNPQDEVPVSKLFAHSGSEITLVARNSAGNGVASGHSLRNVIIRPVTLGFGAFEAGAVSDFSSGTDGWFGAGNLQRTLCQAPIGAILGGDDTNSIADVTFKTFTDIPAHNGIGISMRFVFVKLDDRTQGDYKGQVREHESATLSVNWRETGRLWPSTAFVCKNRA